MDIGVPNRQNRRYLPILLGILRFFAKYVLGGNNMTSSKYNKDVHYVCKIPCINKIEKKYGKLKNYDVILTDERINHIRLRRGIKANEILNNVKEVICKYNLILDADDNCIRYVKLYDNHNIAFVIKLSLDNHKQGNSILSGVIVKTKKLEKIIDKSTIIDLKIW